MELLPKLHDDSLLLLLIEGDGTASGMVVSALASLLSSLMDCKNLTLAVIKDYGDMFKGSQ